MKIVQVVSSISSTNFGIWNAAIFGSSYLKRAHNIDSELWICTKTKNDTIKPEIPFRYFEEHQLTVKGIKKWLSLYNKKDTVFVTHGAWLRPTFIGFRAKRAGFLWVYLSQGMFEPWALKNGWLKKKIYLALFEKRMCQKADIVRAVSKPEEKNLQRLLKAKICLIYNGVESCPVNIPEKSSDTIVYLFLARLHHKKGILPLVKGWSSKMKGLPNVKLLIVGPDEGELSKITPYIGDNIEYLGPRFGDEKKKILQIAHYYVLPTFSEGFPSSVVEAMSYGLIPVVSEGCNFPEIFQEQLGYEVKTDEESIGSVLRQIYDRPYDRDLSSRNVIFVEQNLTEKIIGEQLFSLYSELLKTSF